MHPFTEPEKVNAMSKLKDQHSLIQYSAQRLVVRVYKTKYAPTNDTERLCRRTTLAYLTLQNMEKCDDYLKNSLSSMMSNTSCKRGQEQAKLACKVLKIFTFLWNMKHSMPKQLFGLPYHPWNGQ